MVGRTIEQNELLNLYESNDSQFVVVYGRRRVGKTYLINQTFADKFTFKHAGLSPIELKNMKGRSLLNKQLKSFYQSLIEQGMEKCDKPEDWFEAFALLKKFLIEKDSGSRQVVFIDEFPWLDTPKSDFITAFESFWNNWGCARNNLMLIVCGSATSYILNKLINNHGGLYGRITYQIKLMPFSLKECEELFQEKKIQISRYDIAQAYMMVGGIPYYLNYFSSNLTFPENIDNLFFKVNAKLKDEFNNLFSSTFSNPEATKSIVKLLAKKNIGYTKKEIMNTLPASDADSLNSTLSSLVGSDFVMKYVPFKGKKRDECYKLIDPFSIFYLKIVNEQSSINETYYTDNFNSQKFVSWRGIAFENVCLNHIKQIKAALGISGVSTNQSVLHIQGNENTNSKQIDLIIERKDDVVNVCEIKYYGDVFSVDKKYYETLLGRVNYVTSLISKKSVVQNTLITTFGLKKNEYSGIFSKSICLNDLFN